MPWWRRSQLEVFSGWIAGLGTDSGHRLVVGHWHSSPYGQVTDAMVEDPSGHRTLYAPTARVARFIGAAYHFDEVQVVPCSVRRSGPHWRLRAGPLRLSFTVGRRSRLGWLLWLVPAPLARTPWWAGLQDLVARRLLPGVRTVAAPATDGASGTAPETCTRSSPPRPPSTTVTSVRCKPSIPRSASASPRCPAGHPWSRSPR